ncbi:hypothetical protein KC340_g8424 [Hortaea werneckii]|nr:hypothetical protein KC342_g8868 [Hortaea werneckii]KAI7104028.1 hypothetical protein KC339_g4831 [Hortaea werneckii]KAI7235317.1 hypothetical protein KC365_g5631 [Hortaea werneckii]KAI7317110.1 hypothetical protein KC340_g8424 [Hortaea werneckii]KAI7400365.1 hypothetical protein KC328_g3631 [Hortaea werneckii]
MPFTTFALTYLLGGLTFLPLLLLALLTPAWLLLPERRGSDRDEVEQLVTEEEREGTERLLKAQDEKYTNTTDAAISGTFAVLRSYHFPAAAAALNTRGNGGAAGSTRNGAYDGSTEGSSESVYQSMYRSVFDRSRNRNAASSVLENVDAAIDSDGDDKSVKKKTVSASVFYMVLRHGHLMLYDSAAQLEVRHVISLAHHSISLSEGESLDGDGDEIMKDADLFIKRTAIVLSPTHVPTARQQEPGARPRPFFLFSSNCSEKEDFYHALLSTRNPPPVPQLLLPEEVIKLQSTLHSSSLTGETRAFNALVGRIFLGIHRTTFLETLIRTKIERKIARVQKPAFIASLDVKSISLGNAAPILSSPKLADINIAGDMTLAFDVRYSGGIRVVIAAVAKIDLGSRFKTRTVDLVLSTSLQRLSGHMLLRVKAPPSNRIWFCFETMPDMEIKVEPIVSTRQITYAFILRAIEDRIRSVVGETLVKPNWDDIPFYDTSFQSVRGGIWADEGSGAVEAEAMSAKTGQLGSRRSSNNLIGLDVHGEKTMSMPAFPSTVTAVPDTHPQVTQSSEDLATAATSSVSPLDSLSLKRRSAASLPIQAGESGSEPSKTLRSPSFTSPSPSSPSVALDGATGMPVRTDDASLQPKKWRSRVSLTAQPSRREALDAVREMRDRVSPTTATATTPEGTLGTETLDSLDVMSQSNDLRSAARSGGSLAGDPWAKATVPPRTDSDQSSTASVQSASQRRQEQRKTIMAATAAATTAARNWSWNAINSARSRQVERQTEQGSEQAASSQASKEDDGRCSSDSSGRPVHHHSKAQAHQQPMGRGQPLPPPGMPLPGPEKPRTLWSTTTGSLGNFASGGAVKRKPVLPPRPIVPTENQNLGDSPSDNKQISESATSKALHPTTSVQVKDAYVNSRPQSGDFGPWNENSGLQRSVDDEDDVVLNEATDSEHKADREDIQYEESAPEARPDSTEDAGASMRLQSANSVGQVPPPLPARKTSPRESKSNAPGEIESRSHEKPLRDPADTLEPNVSPPLMKNNVHEHRSRSSTIEDCTEYATADRHIGQATATGYERSGTTSQDPETESPMKQPTNATPDSAERRTAIDD